MDVPALTARHELREHRPQVDLLLGRALHGNGVEGGCGNVGEAASWMATYWMAAWMVMLKAEKHPPKQHVSLGGELCFNPKSMSSRFVSMAITPSMADRFAHQFHYVPLFSTLTQRHPVRPSHPGIRSSSAKMSGLKRLLVPQLSCFRRHFCNGSQIIGHDSKSYIHLFNSLHGTGIIHVYVCPYTLTPVLNHPTI